MLVHVLAKFNWHLFYRLHLMLRNKQSLIELVITIYFF